MFVINMQEMSFGPPQYTPPSAVASPVEQEDVWLAEQLRQRDEEWEAVKKAAAEKEAAKKKAAEEAAAKEKAEKEAREKEEKEKAAKAKAEFDASMLASRLRREKYNKAIYEYLLKLPSIGDAHEFAARHHADGAVNAATAALTACDGDREAAAARVELYKTDNNQKLADAIAFHTHGRRIQELVEEEISEQGGASGGGQSLRAKGYKKKRKSRRRKSKKKKSKTRRRRRKSGTRKRR